MRNRNLRVFFYTVGCRECEYSRWIKRWINIWSLKIKVKIYESIWNHTLDTEKALYRVIDPGRDCIIILHMCAESVTLQANAPDISVISSVLSRYTAFHLHRDSAELYLIIIIVDIEPKSYKLIAIEWVQEACMPFNSTRKSVMSYLLTSTTQRGKQSYTWATAEFPFTLCKGM